MKLILARHGNTFEAHERVVWTGTQNDLPLSTSGEEQAKILGQTLESLLQKHETTLSRIYCSRLKRTQRYAQIIESYLQHPPSLIQDARLDEIDYGAWTGLSAEEVSQRFGTTMLKSWSEQGCWPTPNVWESTELQIKNAVHSFLESLSENHLDTDTILIISSQGKLIYFLKEFPNIFEQQVFKKAIKVRTGNVCEILWSGRETKTVLFWNQSPQIAPFVF